MKTSPVPDLSTTEITRVGHVRDYISGREIRATPEEIDGTQVFSRRLVEDYGYPREHVRTRPQFQVSRSPSDEAGSFPVDIAVFDKDLHDDANLKIIVECKQKNSRNGKKQLIKYMELLRAHLGVWFNGDEHLHLRKIIRTDKTPEYVSIPNIPKFGQRIEDIGMYGRRELSAPSNLKAVFRDIRNHLAGNATGIARDEAFAQEIVNIFL